MLREFLLVIATVARILYKHRIWLVANVSKKEQVPFISGTCSFFILFCFFTVPFYMSFIVSFVVPFVVSLAVSFVVSYVIFRVFFLY